MEYTCWGAARQVTGSMHLLQFESGYRILLDCGLDYESKSDVTGNLIFPFEPSSIDLVILSHAHIDHSGNVPNLIRQGFDGQIICTEPTAYLLDKLWTDSVNIQNMDRKRNPSAIKLYGYADVKSALERILTLPFGKTFEIQSGLSLQFYEAGHILGAASVLLQYTEGSIVKRLGFTGDLGNFGSTLIVDPKPMTDIDYLITESTYANRMHRVRRSAHEELLEQVQDACVKRPGRLIIPAFSVGRTQAILFTLKRLIESGDLPQIPVFADSPLALESTNIHFRFHDLMNEEAREELKSTGELFGFEQLRLVQDEDDQEDMEYQRDPCIIVSSSGMMDGGRIQAHLQDQVMNPMCTVLIAGYCTPGTLGARLLNGENPVRILNKERYVYARIRQTDVFSAHPDEEGLLKYLKNSLSSRLKKLFLIHGVEEDMEVFQTRLKGELSCDVELPEKGQIFRLN